MFYGTLALLGLLVIIIRTSSVMFDFEVHKDKESLEKAFLKELKQKEDEYTSLRQRYDDLSNHIQEQKKLSYEAGYNKALYQIHNFHPSQKKTSSFDKRC